MQKYLSALRVKTTYMLMADCTSQYNKAPNPGNTKHLYNICTMPDQRRRRRAGVVRMLYKCFVFAGKG